MSFVTTYILTVHDEDVENVAELNRLVMAEFNRMEHSFSAPAFRNASAAASERHDANEFFAAHLNHFTVGKMLHAISEVKWNHEECVSLQWKGENDRYWGIYRQ